MDNVAWMALGEAFLNKTSEYIDEDRKSYRDILEDYRDKRDKNLANFEERKTRAGINFGLAKQATQNGATNDMIQQAMDSGPTGLADLNKKLSEFRDKLGKYWDKTQVEVAFNSMLPDDFVSRNLSQSSIETELQKMYGIESPSVGSRKDDRSWLQRALMIDPIGAAKAELDATPLQDGYSELDISKIAQASTWKSLNPGASVNYPEIKIWTAEDQLTFEQQKDTFLRNKDNKLFQSGDYKTYKDQQETYANEAGMTLEDGTLTNGAKMYAQATAMLQHMRNTELSPFYTKYWQIYGQSFLNRNSGEAAVYGGDDAMDYIVFSDSDMKSMGATLKDDVYTLDGRTFSKTPDGLGYRADVGRPSTSQGIVVTQVQNVNDMVKGSDTLDLAGIVLNNTNPASSFIAGVMDKEASIRVIKDDNNAIIKAWTVNKDSTIAKPMSQDEIDSLNALISGNPPPIVQQKTQPYILPKGEFITLPNDSPSYSVKLGSAAVSDYRITEIKAGTVKDQYIVTYEDPSGKKDRFIVKTNKLNLASGKAKAFLDAGFDVLDAIQKYKP